jgi:hypothetical protein
MELYDSSEYDKEEVLFGHDFVIQLADSNAVTLPLASDFLKALMNPNRPRNEQCEELRTLILLPLSMSHPVELCELLVESMVDAVSKIEGDKDEAAMKCETVTLTRLQEYREIMENLSRYCVDCLKENREGGERMMEAFGRVYEMAPFALESQLETLLEDDAGWILNRFQDGKEEEEEMMEVEKIEAEVSPLYASLNGGSLNLRGGQLQEKLEEIAEKLSITDSERWDDRLAALIDLERLLASGLQGPDRILFIEKLRKMPLNDQFADLRSQVTHAACRVAVCTSFEYRSFIEEDANDTLLLSPLQQFIENCTPAVMKLCTSGTRLMANQGVACLQSLCTTSSGHARLLSTLCEEIVDKKSKNNNRKRGAVIALTSALRVWDEHYFKNIELIANAVKEANSNRDPGVREEGRKAYWAMHSCDKLRNKAEEMYGERSREYKNLVKCRMDVDAEWNEGGKMWYLLNHGVLLEEGKGARPSTAPPRVNNSNKRPASAGTKDRATPASKAGRYSTPAKVEVGSTSKRPSSAKLPMNTPSCSRRTTFATGTSATKSSSIKTPLMKPERKSMGVVNGRQSDSSMKVKMTPVSSANVIQSTLHSDMALSDMIYDEKENDPTTPTSHSSPKVGTPIVSLLARPSPLSIEKCRSRNALNQVVTMLSDTNNPSEQYLGIQVLALFAKDHSEHESWDNLFGVVLELLLGE